MNTLLIVGAIVLVLAFWQRRNLGRVLTVISAQFGKATNWLWAKDPIAIYQAEVDHYASDIREATVGLEEYRGNVSTMQRRVAKGAQDEATLLARIKIALNNKDEMRASDYAVQLKRVQVDLTKAKENLSTHNEAYQNNLKKIKYARQQIEDRRVQAQQLNAELKMSKADAELAKLSEKFNVKANTLDGLGEIEEEVQRQVDMNKGKAQVALDLSSEGLAEIEEQEQVQRTEAKELLDKVKAEMGIK